MAEPAIEPGSASDPDRREALLTPAFASLLVAQASFGFAFSGFFLLPKYVDVVLGAGPAEIGLLTAVYGVAVVLCVPAGGALVDRFGRRGFLTAGGSLMAAGSLGFLAVDSMGPLLYGLRVVHAAAFAMAFAAGAALAVDLAPASRLSQAIGWFGLSFLSMNAIAPAVVEVVSERAGWPAAFATLAGGAISCALLSRRIPDVRPAPVSKQDAPGLFEVARRPKLLRMMIVIGLMGIGMGAVFIYHQPFAISLGIPNLRSFFIAYAAVAVFVRLVLGGVADSMGANRVSLAALTLYVPLVTSMAWLQPGGLAWFGAGLGIAHGFAYPALNAIAVGDVPDNERGKVMALFQGAFNVGFAMLSLPLGLLAEQQGYPAVFLLGGASVFAALLLLASSPEGRRAR